MGLVKRFFSDIRKSPVFNLYGKTELFLFVKLIGFESNFCVIGGKIPVSREEFFLIIILLCIQGI